MKKMFVFSLMAILMLSFSATSYAGDVVDDVGIEVVADFDQGFDAPVIVFENEVQNFSPQASFGELNDVPIVKQDANINIYNSFVFLNHFDYGLLNRSSGGNFYSNYNSEIKNVVPDSF